MCGIAGFSGPFSPDLLLRMNQMLAHRGPDDQGTWHDAAHRVGLAHRRLSIIDLSPRGQQPMWDLTRTAVISFNGEIFNYPELRAELEKQGYRFQSTTDTEVLLNLYLRDGPDMLRKLNGMFAFALWDTRDRSLLLARDGAGVKPLYYAQTPHGFIFASELKALLQEPSLDRTLDTAAIQYHLTYLWSPAPHTLLRSVRKLQPGRAMLVREGKIERQWSFYDLPFDQPIEPMSLDEGVTRLEAAMHEAVRRQMIADVPVGAFLSGGLDSSAIVHFARQHTTHKLNCFTIGFKDSVAAKEGMTEDLPYARRVAEYYSVNLRTIFVGTDEMIRELERMIYYLDEPQADPAAINTMLICRLARESGIKVLLSGVGGDDILSGYRRHFALVNEGYWGWAPHLVRRGLAAAAHRLPQHGGTLRRLVRAFEFADLDPDHRLISYYFHSRPKQTYGLLHPDLRPQFISPFGPLEESLGQLPNRQSALNRMLYLDGKHFLADHNLMYTDKMAMANGVEVRVPMLDPDLMRLAAALPMRLKLHGTHSKYVFRKMMESYLPKNIIYRPKTGFAVPLRHWLSHELYDYAQDILSESSLNRRGLFDYHAVQAVYRQYRAGADRAYSLFAVMCIELWCRQFLDQACPLPPAA